MAKATRHKRTVLLRRFFLLLLYHTASLLIFQDLGEMATPLDPNHNDSLTYTKSSAIILDL